MRLETDPTGAFYFVKSGAAPHGSSLLRVSPDGKQLRVIARGFRHPYGLGVGPQGEITVADNEGNWVPTSKIDLIQEGGFYGYLGSAEDAQDQQPLPPLCYLPKVADNSCGGQTWVTSQQWGGYHLGQMLHFSWGRCTLHAVLRQQQGPLQQNRLEQAATVRFPDLTFLSGSGEGAFHPLDGQLYVIGLKGWQTGAIEDGSFQRVRYTGAPVYMPASFKVFQNGIRLEFTQPLDKKSAEDVSNYRTQQWNYRWSNTYGSFHYSVAHPDKIGHDDVPIQSAKLLPGGKAVFLQIDGLKPVDQFHLHTLIHAADQTPLAFDIYSTIKFLGL